jgi:glutathione peroxidase
MSIIKILILTLVLSGTAMAENKSCHENLNFTVKTLNDSQEVNLCDAYQGKVIIIVNTASKCAFTGQYEGLEELYKKYGSRGLVVLGFPSNDFGNQEPGTEKEIQSFCRLTYGVQFPMFEKTHVSKNNASPLFKQLGEQKGYPNWNFFKYVIDRNGELIDRYSSFTSPTSNRFIKKIESLL